MRVHPERRMLVATTAAVAWLVAYAVATALTGAEGADSLVLHDVVYLVPIAVGTVALFAAARRATGRMRHAWGVLAVAITCWLVGETLWSVFDLTTGDVPAVSMADVAYLTSSLLVIPGMLLCFRASGQAPGWRAALDASVLLAALVAGSMVAVVLPQLDGSVGVTEIVSASYPVLDMLVLFVLLTQGFGAHRRIPRAAVLVGLAFCSVAVSDGAYAYLVIVRELDDPELWLNLGWQAGAVLVCLAGLAAWSDPEPELVLEDVGRDPGLALVLLGLVATVGVVLADLTSGRLNGLVAVATGYAVLAVAVRLWLTSREHAATTRRLHAALREQERLAVTDTLTGLHNRRFVEEALRLEGERAHRADRTLGVLVVDLDHFKRVNDAYGHAGGDAVLVEAARRLTEVARTGDVVARYGGEEFVLVIPEAGAGELFEVAERVREAIGDRPVAVDGAPAGCRITASVGAALLPEHADTVQDLLRVADRALYAAKARGRDRVHLGPEPAGQAVGAGAPG